jgi:hypothetical protein
MRRVGVVGAVAAVVLGACGGSSSSSGGGTCDPSDLKTMTLTSTGVTPKAQCILPSGTVNFVNNDTVAHDIAGDGAACTALNLGAIAPATSKAATFTATLQTCTFHDANAPGNTAFQGSVTVATAPATGPGY